MGPRLGLRDATAGGEGFLEGGLVLIGAVLSWLDRKGREQGEECGAQNQAVTHAEDGQ